jgi:hypothetical protein
LSFGFKYSGDTIVPLVLFVDDVGEVSRAEAVVYVDDRDSLRAGV